MPIVSLTSQFFANAYLNELDRFVKHTLKIRGYVRYVDDFVLLAPDQKTLTRRKRQIECFLRERLKLEIHPDKVVLQRCNQGIDFLGNIVFPDHQLVRQRVVRSLRRRLAWFQLLASLSSCRAEPSPSGAWQRWLTIHLIYVTHGVPNLALLARMLSTINS